MSHNSVLKILSPLSGSLGATVSLAEEQQHPTHGDMLHEHQLSRPADGFTHGKEWFVFGNISLLNVWH